MYTAQLLAFLYGALMQFITLKEKCLSVTAELGDLLFDG